MTETEKITKMRNEIAKQYRRCFNLLVISGYISIVISYFSPIYVPLIIWTFSLIVFIPIESAEDLSD